MSPTTLKVITWITLFIWSVMAFIGFKTSSSIIKVIALIFCILFLVLCGVQIFMEIKTRKEKKELEELKKS